MVDLILLCSICKAIKLQKWGTCCFSFHNQHIIQWTSDENAYQLRVFSLYNIKFSRAECYCLSRHVFTVPSLSTSGYQFACLELISCDWSTNLALGILESHCRFQLLSIKRFGAWCQSPRCDRVNNSTLIKGRPHCSQSVCRFVCDDIFYLTRCKSSYHVLTFKNLPPFHSHYWFRA